MLNGKVIKCPECGRGDKLVIDACPVCRGQRIVCTRCSMLVREHILRLERVTR